MAACPELQASIPATTVMCRGTDTTTTLSLITASCMPNSGTSPAATGMTLPMNKNLNIRYMETSSSAYVSGTALSYFATYAHEAHKVFESKGDVPQNPALSSSMQCMVMNDAVYLRPIPWPIFCSSTSVVHFAPSVSFVLKGSEIKCMLRFVHSNGYVDRTQQLELRSHSFRLIFSSSSWQQLKTAYVHGVSVWRGAMCCNKAIIFVQIYTWILIDEMVGQSDSGRIDRLHKLTVPLLIPKHAVELQSQHWVYFKSFQDAEQKRWASIMLDKRKKKQLVLDLVGFLLRQLVLLHLCSPCTGDDVWYCTSSVISRPDVYLVIDSELKGAVAFRTLVFTGSTCLFGDLHCVQLQGDAGPLHAHVKVKLLVKINCTCLLKSLSAEVDKGSWRKQLQTESLANKLRLHATIRSRFELQKQYNWHCWVILSLHELNILWDPGGIMSGLGASRNSSGGECHGLGHKRSLQGGPLHELRSCRRWDSGTEIKIQTRHRGRHRTDIDELVFLLGSPVLNLFSSCSCFPASDPCFPV